MVTTGSEDGGEEDFVRFERETAGVFDPEPPEGEVLPPGTEPDEEAEFVFPIGDFITEEIVAGLFAVPANMMARKTGEDWWRLEQDEVDLLGRGIAPPLRFLVEKYLGSNGGPYAVIGATLGAVYGPRVVREMRESRYRQKKQKPRHGQTNAQDNPQNSRRESASSSESVDAESPQSSSEFNVPFEE